MSNVANLEPSFKITDGLDAALKQVSDFFLKTVLGDHVFNLIKEELK